MSKAAKQYHLNQSPLYKLQTKKRLAKVLHVSELELKSLTGKKNLYKEWDDESTKKIRHIENPCSELKRVQKRIASILSKIEAPNFLFCPVKGRSYVDNAKQHVNQNQVRCLDIKTYFVATTSRKVYWFFHTYLCCAEDVAGILTKLSTTKGRLPTGSPLSPILAYFSHITMWENISHLVEKDGCILTVYMDDITVSGEIVKPFLMWNIRHQIHSHGLGYHKDKLYNGNFSEITGVINKGGKILPPNRQFRKIYQLKKDFEETLDFREKEKLSERLLGRNAQISQIIAANKN